MTVRFRFGIGPFRFSYRFTRTQAQKRAAARQRAALRRTREARRSDPSEHVKVTETGTSVEIGVVNPRGLSPGQQDEVMALVQKLHTEYSGIPAETAAERAAIDRAAREHVTEIAQHVARQDEPGMLSSIKDEALQSAVVEAILREAADHAGDSG
jgi:hypothetical protein